VRAVEGRKLWYYRVLCDVFSDSKHHPNTAIIIVFILILYYTNDFLSRIVKTLKIIKNVAKTGSIKLSFENHTLLQMCHWTFLSEEIVSVLYSVHFTYTMKERLLTKIEEESMLSKKWNVKELVLHQCYSSSACCPRSETLKSLCCKVLLKFCMLSKKWNVEELKLHQCYSSSACCPRSETLKSLCCTVLFKFCMLSKK